MTNNTQEMELLFDKAKQAFWLVVTMLVSVLTPVKNVLLLLFVAFIFNVISGLAADVHANKKGFDLKKAFTAIKQLLFYFTLVVFIDFGSRLMNDLSISEYGVKWITYIVVYFYLTNIFRNAAIVYPKNEAIKFMYDVLTTEIFQMLKSKFNAIKDARSAMKEEKNEKEE